MLARLRTATVIGIEASLVDVEVDVSFGLPSFTMVGLPGVAIRESRDRVRAAIRNSGFEFPRHRITVNLAPADLRKRGTLFDLPIAVGILAADGHAAGRYHDDLLLLGELSLDGSVQPAAGVLPVALTARRRRFREHLLPHHNIEEAALVGGLHLTPVQSLADALDALAHPPSGPPPARAQRSIPTDTLAPDFLEVHGQLRAKRALEMAAAGGHHGLFVGPPGTGKTMMAKRLPGRPAPADARRSPGNDGRPLGRRPDARRWRSARPPAFSGAASHHLACGPRRRRLGPSPRRDQLGAQRRPLFRRIA